MHGGALRNQCEFHDGPASLGLAYARITRVMVGLLDWFGENDRRAGGSTPHLETCPKLVYIFRTVSTAIRVGRGDSSLRMKGLRPKLLQAAVSSQLRIPSLTPSQIHLTTPSSFTAMSCRFHFERLLRTRE